MKNLLLFHPTLLNKNETQRQLGTRKKSRAANISHTAGVITDPSDLFCSESQQLSSLKNPMANPDALETCRFHLFSTHRYSYLQIMISHLRPFLPPPTSPSGARDQISSQLTSLQLCESKMSAQIPLGLSPPPCVHSELAPLLYTDMLQFDVCH